MRTCLRCILMFLAALCIAGVALTGLFIWFVADWLAAGEVPQHSDAIVVLAGAPERVLLSRLAPDVGQLLYTRFGVQFPREEETSTRILTASGVPLERIELFGADSKSTVEEMETLRGRYATVPLRLLVVTSPLHARRARMVAHDVLGDTAIQLAIVATPYQHVPKRWWADQDAAPSIVLEVTKIAFYRLGGRYRAAEP